MKRILLISLMLIGLSSFTHNADERYRLEGAVYYAFEHKKITGGNNSNTGHGGIFSIGVMAEYKYEMSKKVDFTVGPKVYLTGGASNIPNFNTTQGRGSVNLVLKGEVNYSVARNIKVYSGMELGVGVFIKQVDGIDKSVEANVAATSKGLVGVKLLDKYNLALFGGYEDRIITGLELGYTF
ncbi:hypothetical protein [Streptobacillus ratti]|uniref:hypothetical protein n=1 Tax=Streptobacillus ratti TaxID=1720557 RepID=UPI000934A932|nr:hypothetical protein [Streptobacillus ratti]